MLKLFFTKDKYDTEVDNNEQNPYNKYKRILNGKCRTIQTRKQTS